MGLAPIPAPLPPFQFPSGGAAPWTPASVTGLQLWYDASDNGTLFQDSAGTIAVTADGDPVGYWGDKSGNVRHVVQATPGRRPLYKTSGIDTGKTGILFDDIDDALARAGLGLSGGQTVAIVYRIESIPSASEFDSALLYSDGTTCSHLLLGGSGTGYQLTTWRFAYTTSAASVGIANAHSTSKRRLLIRYDGGTNTLPASYDALLDGAGATVVASATLTVSPSQAVLGTRADGAFPPALNLAEILVYNSRLSDGDRTSLEAYLAAKW